LTLRWRIFDGRTSAPNQTQGFVKKEEEFAVLPGRRRRAEYYLMTEAKPARACEHDYTESRHAETNENEPVVLGIAHHGPRPHEDNKRQTGRTRVGNHKRLARLRGLSEGQGQTRPRTTARVTICRRKADWSTARSLLLLSFARWLLLHNRPLALAYRLSYAYVGVYTGACAYKDANCIHTIPGLSVAGRRTMVDFVIIVYIQLYSLLECHALSLVRVPHEGSLVDDSAPNELGKQANDVAARATPGPRTMLSGGNMMTYACM